MEAYMKAYEKWLNSPAVDEATKAELEAIKDDDKEIRERFTQMLAFGTAGLRGIMRAGLNGMNIYMVNLATQGLADLINEVTDGSGKASVAIAYDSRNNSPAFAKEAACVLAANGIRAYLFESLRPTPELSFALRETGSIAGINITASHNTKEYNGYKAYWSDGAQCAPEQAQKVADVMERIDMFEDVKSMDYDEALADGRIVLMGEEMDEKYLQNVLAQSVGGEYVAKAADDLKIVYTPFHGTGYKLVPEVLKRLGMKHVLTVPEQMVIDGDFPTVKSPNPEYREGFDLAVALAEKNDVDMIIGTDPDGDRTGLVVRDRTGEYRALTGNQIGVLLLDYLIRARKEQGTLAADSVAIKSVVSTTMADRICEVQGVELMNVLTGFKYIGEKIKEFEETGEHTYLFGFEESMGYLAGTYARDKDAVVASMLIAEMACYYYLQGKTLADAIGELYETYGYYREKVDSFVFQGLDGQAKMKQIMNDLREHAPAAIGSPVERIRDFSTGVVTDMATGETSDTGLPKSNILFYDLADRGTAIIRPSGTEPKIKLYIMAAADSLDGADAKLAAIEEAGAKLLG